jgi:hypothetical protein
VLLEQVGLHLCLPMAAVGLGNALGYHAFWLFESVVVLLSSERRTWLLVI